MRTRGTILAAAMVIGLASGTAAQQPFGGLSAEGRATLAAAMAKEEIPGHDEEVRAARTKILSLLAADELDLDAIEDAQKAERQLVMQDYARAAARMRAAYADLSVADRKAFATMMAMRERRMQQRMKLAKDRMERFDRMMTQHQEDLRRLRDGRGPAQQVSD
ncbi:hypothetical protein ACSMXM_12425 [Pacificimonas sp. ICDLI1SI03]